MLKSAVRVDGFDHARMRAVMEETAAAYALIDADLAIAAMDPAFALELCLACWERDWNHSGDIDEDDRRLLQIEIDAHGNELPEGDPRRTPTFRFDTGDLHWARAMVSFQHAALELILIGLDHADRSRQAYLDETDDDREWVPNPRHKSHPVPLLVDDALYQLWHAVLGDVRRMIAGEEALSVAELAQLGDHRWAKPPRGYIHIGKMLAEPKDIVLDLEALDRDAESAADETEASERILARLLGAYYVMEMKASPLVGRLARMKREMDRGEDTFERKLRYLLWLN